ncbi:protein bicaudal C isoform X2 [Bacillus rossius redtenbacheri]|uniref:protein bicaudal C isoform X2 n=1 Tax=Bacillus rossius redtenbacheri TaxID=93214 RepID=UPI002FDCD1D1
MASWEQARAQPDCVSEVSDCGTSQGSAYGDGREELAELAAALGLAVGELYEDRFRVDRRRLERLLQGEHENGNGQTADAFFQKIMKDTLTHIAWPSRLKIGAKSKKDPYVRIAGRPDDVRLAKEKVIGTLDTRATRVTMKMDVSYTDHSHIIGKGGLTIKKVMEETKCHIHFPDSNRNNAMEKSNQVSISGEVEGVEKARQRVRALMPLIFSFELPVVTAAAQLPDANSPDLKHIQETYNVQVMFRTRPKLHSTLVVVKGCEWEVDRVKDATVLLVNYLCESLANQVSVQMSLEISPQHHCIVLGQHSINLKNIMARTGVQILFSDAGDPNIPALKKSYVNISGPIHNVYIARQQLVGSLPLVLMFDLPEDFNVDSDYVIQLTQRLDVLINIRPKPKQNNSSVTIKGIERNATNIYEARRKLLRLDEPRVVAQIPATYYIPESSRINFLNDCMTNASPFPSLYAFNGGFSALSGFPLGLPRWGQCLAPLQLLTGRHHLAPPLAPPSTGYSSGYSSMFSSSQSLASDSPDFNAGVYPLMGNTSGLSSPVSPSANSGGFSTTTLNPSDSSSQEGKYDDVLQSPLTQLRNYDQKKVLAAQAMQGKPQRGEARVPTSAWAGCGLSQSTPPAAQRCRTQLFSSQNGKYGVWGASCSPAPQPELPDLSGGTSSAANSNYLDFAPSSVVGRVLGAQPSSLAAYLASIGLDKYTYLFASHEIDLDVFKTLTESDLREIGVNTMGARRKMLIAITNLKQQASQSLFSGSAAPGAERKTRQFDLPPVRNNGQHGCL